YDAYCQHVASIIGSPVTDREGQQPFWEEMAGPFSRATYAVDSAFLRPRTADSSMPGGRMRTLRNPVYEAAIGSAPPEEMWEVWIPAELARKDGLRVFWIQTFVKGKGGRWVPYESAIYDPTDAGRGLIPTPWG